MMFISGSEKFLKLFERYVEAKEKEVAIRAEQLALAKADSERDTLYQEDMANAMEKAAYAQGKVAQAQQTTTQIYKERHGGY